MESHFSAPGLAGEIFSYINSIEIVSLSQSGLYWFNVNFFLTPPVSFYSIFAGVLLPIFEAYNDGANSKFIPCSLSVDFSTLFFKSNKHSCAWA